MGICSVPALSSALGLSTEEVVHCPCGASGMAVGLWGSLHVTLWGSDTPLKVMEILTFILSIFYCISPHARHCSTSENRTIDERTFMSQKYILENGLGK